MWTKRNALEIGGNVEEAEGGEEDEKRTENLRGKERFMP